MRTLAFVLLLAACKKSPEHSAAPTPAPSTSSDAAPVDARPDAAPDAALATGPAPVDAETLLDHEHVGPLTFGAKLTDLVAALGAPKTKSPRQMEGATGQYVYTASWPLVDVELAADSARDPGTARMLTVRDPALSTARGIHVGSTLAELAAAYPKSEEQQEDNDQYLVGSVYGGMLFTIRGGTVTQIAVGPFAF